MKNNKVFQTSGFKFLIVVFTFSFLLLGFTCAEEQKLTLDISVVNPSNEEAREVEVKVDLPQELKKEDIVSSDGLKLDFDAEKKCLFVEGKVLLQSAETTIYKIVVQDVWIIPEEEIKKLRAEVLNSVSGSERSVLNGRLDNISKLQKDSIDNIGAHILAYRQNQKEFNAIKDELRFASSGIKVLRNQEQRIIWIVLWLIILGAFVFLIARKKQYLEAIINKLREKRILDRRRFVRLPNKAEIQHRLLPEEKFGSMLPVKDVSQGGIAVNLDRSYPLHSAIELKLKLPSCAEILTSRGFVAWQKKITPPGSSEYYLTGISFAEVAQEHYQRLKDFIAAQRKA